MSHVTNIDLEVKDLEALEKAASDIGCNLVYNVSTFKWYGHHVGDYPLPKGFKKDDMGKCDHVIRVKGADSKTYEVGVVERKDKQRRTYYVLLWDFYQGGYGLQGAVGKDGTKIQQMYAVNAAERKLRRMGRRVKRTVMSDGRIKLVS